MKAKKKKNARVLSKAKSKSRRKSKKAHSDEAHESRGLWSGAISFGLVNIPVKLVSAREQQDLHFMMLDPSNLSPVGYKYYNKSTGEEVKRNQTVKAFEHKTDEYVIMTEADFKKANPIATQTIDIENFVNLSEIDPVYFEKAYYLLPKKGGEKAYALLCQALQKTDKVAIAKIVIHTKQHLVAVMARDQFLMMEMLHFASDVIDISELGDWKNAAPKAKIQPQEVQMAEQLIEDMTTKWKPADYKDTYRQDIMKQVQAKVKAGKATEITEDFVEKEETETTSAKDLMPLLRKSLATKKKHPSKNHERTLH